MASRLLGSSPRAASIATGGSCWRRKKCANNYYAREVNVSWTNRGGASRILPNLRRGSYVTRALWHKTCKLSKEYCIVISPQNNLKHHFKSIEVRSKCDKRERKYFMNATTSEAHESEPLAPVSKSISESIKDVMNLSLKLARPYVIITTVLDILSTSLLAAENLSDLSPAFFIGLLQFTVATLGMTVYQGAMNDLADVEIDKINKPHHPLASGKYSSRTVVIVAISFLFMCVGVGWIVESWPMTWALLASFVFGNAYAINLPFLKWKRFTSLAVVCTVAQAVISVNLASFLHMKTHVLKRAAIYPRSMIFTLAFNVVIGIVVTLVKDIPDIEGDKAGGIQTLAVRLGPERVFWFCVSLVEMAYGAAILVGATSPFLWNKIVMVSAHAIMALVLWYNVKSVDLKSKASSQSFYMTLFKLFWAESIVIALAR